MKYTFLSLFLVFSILFPAIATGQSINPTSDIRWSAAKNCADTGHS